MSDYIQISDVRAAGLTDLVAYPDAAVQAAIKLWQQFIDRACRQWFDPKPMTMKFDGNDSDTIHFGVPIISVEYMKINADENELSVDFYKVYSARTYPDDRRNPRIKLVSRDMIRDIFIAPRGLPLKFYKGRQSNEIKGVFGFTEEDGSVPALIKRAMTKLVVEKLTNPIYSSTGSPPVSGMVTSETTDGHSISYESSASLFGATRSGVSGITGDQEILDILKLYRAPIGIATPAHWMTER